MTLPIGMMYSRSLVDLTFNTNEKEKGNKALAMVADPKCWKGYKKSGTKVKWQRDASTTASRLKKVSLNHYYHEIYYCCWSPPGLRDTRCCVLLPTQTLKTTQPSWVKSSVLAVTEVHAGYQFDSGLYIQGGPAFLSLMVKKVIAVEYSGKVGYSTELSEDLSVYGEVLANHHTDGKEGSDYIQLN